jgi:hypothetical protein
MKTTPCPECEGRGHKLIGCEETGYSTSTCWRCDGRGKEPAPTVRLIISVDAPKGLIGGSDVGAAITNRTVALSDEVRELLRKYGYTECLLVLDAEENLDPAIPDAA